MGDTLREYSREGLLAIINALPMAVAVVDKNRAITMVNKMTLEFTNKNKDQLIGAVGGTALGCINSNCASQGCGFGDNCVRCRLREALQTTLEKEIPQFMIETTMIFGHLGERVLRFSTLPLKLVGEMAALLSIEDMTAARTHEQIRLEKEKLTAVLETTGGICHELSQPLQVIMGYCEILSENDNLDKETASAVQAIFTEVNKLAKLSHDLTHITHYKTKPYLKSKIIDIKESSSK